MIDNSLKQRPEDLGWLENQVSAGDEQPERDMGPHPGSDRD